MPAMYERDLAAVHHAHFTDLARAAGTLMTGLLDAAGWTRGRVADVGCGSGAATAVLVDAGYQVTGHDPSSAMLAIARHHVPAARFVQSTASTAVLGERLVGVLAVGEVLGYDADGDLQATVDAMAAALRPGGVVLMDVPGVGRHGADGVAQHWHEVPDGGLVAVRAETRGLALTRRVVTFTSTRGSLHRRHDEDHRLRLIPAEDLRAALAKAGFVAIRALDSYGEGSPAFGPHWPAFTATRA